MSAFVAVLAAVGILLWPVSFGRWRLAIVTTSASASAFVPVSASDPPAASGFAWSRAVQLIRRIPRRTRRTARRAVAISSLDVLGLLEAVAPALEAGIAPAATLRIAADARSGPDRPGSLTSVTRDMASAAAHGASLGPLWRAAAGSTGSAELLLLAQAWSLTEDMGAPLAQAVRTTAGLVEARIAHERRLAAAVAGARATVNVLTVLPVGGPLMALMLGIGPGELYAGSRLTEASLLLGLCLAGVGRLWVRRMVRGVAGGPVIA